MSDDGDAVITLNAPHRLNTIGRQMASGVQHALDLASEDSTVTPVLTPSPAPSPTRSTWRARTAPSVQSSN